MKTDVLQIKISMKSLYKGDDQIDKKDIIICKRKGQYKT